jgi:hypothetical protein
MGLVDRWLARPLASADAATFATSATSLKKVSIPAGSDVASRLRHSATTEPTATGSRIVSHPVTTGLRHENPQNSAALTPLSQMSQLSQRPTAEVAALDLGAGARERGDAEAQRAPIIEHDGKIPREWVEGFAWLDPDRPPAGVPLRRCRRFVDDGRLFLDSPFYAVAAALGWGPHDLFGCDRDMPFARIDQCGLLWLLNGARVVILAEDAAAIETPTGARETWRRKPTEPGRVLAWELAR